MQQQITGSGTFPGRPRCPAEMLCRFWSMLAHEQGDFLGAARMAPGVAVTGQSQRRSARTPGRRGHGHRRADRGMEGRPGFPVGQAGPPLGRGSARLPVSGRRLRASPTRGGVAMVPVGSWPYHDRRRQGGGDMENPPQEVPDPDSRSPVRHVRMDG